MFRSLLIITLLFLALVSISSASESDVKILSSTSNSLTIEFTPQNWQTSDLNIDQQSFSIYTFHKSTVTTSFGQPQIPARVLTFGVPINGTMSVTVLDSDFQTVPNKTIIPVPEFEKSENGYISQYEKNLQIYSSTSAFPEQQVIANEPYTFRKQKVAKIVIHPLQFFPQQKRVRQYNRIVLQLNFTNAAEIQTPATAISKDESWYKDLLVNYDQAKKWRLPKTRALRKATTDPFAGDNWYKIIIATKDTETKEGFFKVDGTALSAAGIPLASLDPKTIQVFNNGGRELPHDVNKSRPDSLIETPILVFGDKDGKMDASDYIIFYARSLDGYDYNLSSESLAHYIHRYSKENVLWLTFGKSAGKRILTKAPVSQTGLIAESGFRDLHFIEEEITNFYKSGDEWLGASLSSTKRSQSFLFSLPGAIPGEQTIVRAALTAATPGSHSFKLLANGNDLGSFDQSGASKRYITGQQNFETSGVLLDGNNTITVEYLNTQDNKFAYVDWIEVEYSRKFQAANDKLLFHSPIKDGPVLYEISNFGRDDISVYDISGPATVHQISSTINSGKIKFADDASFLFSKKYIACTPAAYLPVTRIEKDEVAHLRTTRNAEFIIITHDDFIQQAQELKSLRENWNMSHTVKTEVVKISDVMDEFGWGIQDPAAIRDFLIYAEENWGGPQYVLLFGDGHYDYKNNLNETQSNNLIIPYETDSNSEYYTRTTDDWFTYTKGPNNGMQMVIGRLPTQTVDDAQAVVQKIINYETTPSFGEWRKTITIVGDDELVSGGTGNETIHTQQAEVLAEQHVPKLIDVKKIYLMEYPSVRTASVSGVTKPLANEALLDQINRGTLLVNFIGHGNEDLWTHENVLYGPTDFDKIQNGEKTAWWVAATCEFAYWDLPEKQSLAEKILTAPNRGAVGLVSSARLAFAHSNAAFNYAFYDELFEDYQNTGLTKRIGDAAMLAKNSLGEKTNSEKYGVFGDPCMRLGAPRYRAVIDNISPDSIQALRKISITGHVEKDNQAWSDFSGKIQLRVFDSRKNKTYTTQNGRNVYYKMDGNSIFKGVAPVRDGQFKVEFIVPKDISYGGSEGKVSLYFWNDDSEGTGTYENLIVGGTAVDLVDHKGPKIHLHFGNPDFAPGDYAPANPTLSVEISDSLSGVNIAGDIGHQIVMTLDDDFGNSKDVTDFFEYNEGSFTAGKVTYPLRDITVGEHIIQIKAWDNSNNSSIIESIFSVLSDEELTVRNPLNYPNPMKNETTFTFELSRDAEVTLKIYSVAGRLIKKFEPIQGQIGYNIFPENWDGTDNDGDKIANGVYLFKIAASTIQEGETRTAEKIQKLIIAN
jgi:hypothetical protein